MSRPIPSRQMLLTRMAAALHRAELREKDYHEDPPTYNHLPEWAQYAYRKRADAALRVAEAAFRVATAARRVIERQKHK